MPVVVVTVTILAVVTVGLINAVIDRNKLSSVTSELSPGARGCRRLSRRGAVGRADNGLCSCNKVTLAIAVGGVRIKPASVGKRPAIGIACKYEGLDQHTVCPGTITSSVIARGNVRLQGTIIAKCGKGLSLTDGGVGSNRASRGIDCRMLSSVRAPVTVRMDGFERGGLIHSTFTFSNDGRALAEVSCSSIPRTPGISGTTFIRSKHIRRLGNAVLRFQLSSLRVRRGSRSRPLVITHVS